MEVLTIGALSAVILLIFTFHAIHKSVKFQKKITQSIRNQTCTKCERLLSDAEINYISVGHERISYRWIAKCSQCSHDNLYLHRLPLKRSESTAN